MSKDTPNTLEIGSLFEYLPHRYPFLLVDRVTELVRGERVKGYKNVTINEPFFDGHFPGHPIMPACSSSRPWPRYRGYWRWRPADAPGGCHLLLAGMDNTRFKRPVVPGDRLDMASELLVQRRTLMKFACKAHVAEELACETEILCVARVGEP